MSVSPRVSGKSRYILLNRDFEYYFIFSEIGEHVKWKIYLFVLKGRFFDVDPNWTIGYTIRTPYSIVYHSL